MVSKGKKDMSKEFKSGDKARIVGNVSDHSFQLGEIVLLEEWDDNGWVALHLDRSDHWYVEEDDLEGIGDEGVKKDSNTDYNNVSKPAHYNHGDGIECIDYIKQVLGKEGFVAYCRGNQMKYQHRAFYKGNPVEDMEKAHQYQAWAIETLKEIHK